MYQDISQQEAEQIWAAVKIKLRPAVLDELNSTNQHLYAAVGSRLAGRNEAISVDSVTKMLLEMKSIIEWKVPPQKTAKEQQAESNARRDAANAQGLGHHRTELDRPDLNKPQPSAHERNQARISQEVQVQAQRDIHGAILGYTTNGPYGGARINWAATRERQADLKKIRVFDGTQVDWPKTLEAVQAAIKAYGD